MVSMKDIAAACGVSVATVSKALNNHSDIGEETKAMVKRKAKEMGYTTHVFAWAANDVGEKAADRFYPISVKEVDAITEITTVIRLLLM